jgi:WhiB family transcriptional regulator, redox-sensing transcriptional regulator
MAEHMAERFDINASPPNAELAESDSSSWQDQANCMGTDPDLFFPERGQSVRKAKEVCRGCVVRDPCLEYALTNGERFGVWGGMSERERRRHRRERALGLIIAKGNTQLNSDA